MSLSNCSHSFVLYDLYQVWSQVDLKPWFADHRLLESFALVNPFFLGFYS